MPKLHSISINARCDGKVLESAHAVATGLSCGVDSFYTILKHIDTGIKTFDLTHLTYFNIMNHPRWILYGEDSSRDFTNARIAYVRPAARELGLKLVSVDTNLDLLYRSHSLLATYLFRYLGTVLALQKLFSTYYWSSAYSSSQFAFSFDDIGLCELLLVQCLSNENTTFYSAGSEATRFEKTAFISDFEITRHYLNVCWNSLYNCTDKCEKCKRTVLTLHALGKLQFYQPVFALDDFTRRIEEYLGFMLFMRRNESHHSYHDGIYRHLAQRGFRIPFRSKVHACRMELASFLDYSKKILRELAAE